MSRQKIKKWSVSILEDKDSTIDYTTGFYASDTDVVLIVELMDEGFIPSTAKMLLLNNLGESFTSEELEVVDQTIKFPLYTEDRKLIEHEGSWRFQVVYTKDGEQYTSKENTFSVNGYLSEEEKLERGVMN